MCRSHKKIWPITKLRKIFCWYIKNSALLWRGVKFDILHHFIFKYDNCCNAKWSMDNAQWGLFVLVKFAPGSLERNLRTNLTFNQKQKKLKYEAFLKMWPRLGELCSVYGIYFYHSFIPLILRKENILIIQGLFFSVLNESYTYLVCTCIFSSR